MGFLRTLIGASLLLLLAPCASGQSCTPLPTCGDPGVPPEGPCGSPTPAITWTNPNPDGNGTGRRIYWRYVGALSWQRSDSVSLPCWYMENPAYWPQSVYDIKVCPQDTQPNYPVQRILPDYAQLRDVEFAVSNYRINADGTEAESELSNILTICVPSWWSSGPYN